VGKLQLKTFGHNLSINLTKKTPMCIFTLPCGRCYKTSPKPKHGDVSPHGQYLCSGEDFYTYVQKWVLGADWFRRCGWKVQMEGSDAATSCEATESTAEMGGGYGRIGGEGGEDWRGERCPVIGRSQKGG
jgi:hypothetical protein